MQLNSLSRMPRVTPESALPPEGGQRVPAAFRRRARTGRNRIASERAIDPRHPRPRRPDRACDNNHSLSIERFREKRIHRRIVVRKKRDARGIRWCFEHHGSVTGELLERLELSIKPAHALDYVCARRGQSVLTQALAGRHQYDVVPVCERLSARGDYRECINKRED